MAKQTFALNEKLPRGEEGEMSLRSKRQKTAARGKQFSFIAIFPAIKLKPTATLNLFSCPLMVRLLAGEQQTFNNGIHERRLRKHQFFLKLANVGRT
jgi:hypothetical protein